MLTFGGTQYSIAHLAPCTRRVKVPLQGGHSKAVLVEFHFSNHCYSRGPAADEVIPADMLVMDGVRERIFDVRRYSLSHLVMECIDELLAQDGDISWSRHNNFFQVDLVQEGESEPIRFYIFMRARKERPEGGEKRIRVQVESSYPELPNVPTPDYVRVESIMSVFGRMWVE